MLDKRHEAVTNLLKESAERLTKAVEDNGEALAQVVERTMLEEAVKLAADKAFENIRKTVDEVKAGLDEAVSQVSVKKEEVTKIVNDTFDKMKAEAEGKIDFLKKIIDY